MKLIEGISTGNNASNSNKDAEKEKQISDLNEEKKEIENELVTYDDILGKVDLLLGTIESLKKNIDSAADSLKKNDKTAAGKDAGDSMIKYKNNYVVSAETRTKNLKTAVQQKIRALNLQKSDIELKIKKL